MNAVQQTLKKLDEIEIQHCMYDEDRGIEEYYGSGIVDKKDVELLLQKLEIDLINEYGNKTIH